MRALLSALLIILLTCAHGPLSAAMPHDFAESHHHTGDHHHPPRHQDDHATIAVLGAETGDSSSGQAPSSAGHHQHLVADAATSSGITVAFVRPTAMKRLPANDSLLVQENLSIPLEPPIA
jgi:hypothetical protein